MLSQYLIMQFFGPYPKLLFDLIEFEFITKMYIETYIHNYKDCYEYKI